MLREVKIECENWHANRTLQLKLFELGVKWPSTKPTSVWNSRRRGKYLFLYQNQSNGSWWLGWGGDMEWERCDFPKTTAKTFLAELENCK